MSLIISVFVESDIILCVFNIEFTLFFNDVSVSALEKMIVLFHDSQVFFINIVFAMLVETEIGFRTLFYQASCYSFRNLHPFPFIFLSLFKCSFLFEVTLRR